MSRHRTSFAALAAALVAGPALAGGYTCPSGGTYVGQGKCSDGSLAVYTATVLQGGPKPRQPAASGPPSAAAVRSLLGAWSTRVPGGVWTSPSAIPGWDTLHIGIGALSGLLVIYPNGAYVWNAYGGKRGSWAPSGNPDYPIALDDPAERRVWQVGLNQRKPNAIYIRESHGYYWYEGVRPR